jgi:hypothetical protein
MCVSIFVLMYSSTTDVHEVRHGRHWSSRWGTRPTRGVILLELFLFIFETLPSFALLLLFFF